MLPEGWKHIKLSSICNRISDGLHSTPNYTEKSDYFFVNGNNIKNGKLVIHRNTKCISKSEYQKHKKDFGPNTILMSINGTIGNLALYQGEEVVLGKSAAYIDLCDNVDRYYIYTLLSSQSIQRFFEAELTGSTIRNLSLKTIKQTTFHMPPFEEQKMIGHFLFCWDQSIEKTIALIEHKRQQKKALARLLLTGKQRFPEFSDSKWKDGKIGQMIVTGKVRLEKGKPLTRSLSLNGFVPVIAGGQSVSCYHDEPTHSHECITVSASGAYAGFVWHHKGPIWASDCNVLWAQKEQTAFLYYALKNQQHRIYKLQSGGAQPHVYASDMKTLTIPDLSFEEQTKIAKTLSIADCELDLLNQKLKALKEQKKGLMQQLLTGKKRLKLKPNEMEGSNG